jgi:competence/damage-inducible protein CinA-like protein
LLAIGDEVLRGEIVNGNAAFLSEKLFELGVEIGEQVVVSDDPTAIRGALLRLRASFDVIVATGGLGPTEDDRTVDVVADLLGVDSPAHPASLDAMKQRFSTHGFELTPNNLRQVRVPAGGEALPNAAGIAPGFRIALGGAEGYFMPGVPREMQKIFIDEVAPRLRRRVAEGLAGPRLVRTWHVYGMGESHIDHRLAGLLEHAPDATLHFRTASPENHVKVIVRGPDAARAQETLEKIEAELRKRIGAGIYGVDGDSFPMAVGRALSAHPSTVALAESCTGGMAGELLTSVPGSSAYFLGGVMAYSNEMKEKLLGVKAETLATFGAVSEPCAREMAEGVQKLCGSTLAVGITGIAGPDGGSPEKPVGTVCFACVGPGTPRLATKLFAGGRDQVRRAAAYFGLELARRYFDNRKTR